MTFAEAKAFVIPFGQHAGKALDDIPLSYLDWLYGQHWIRPELGQALRVYLGDKTIARELEREVEEE